MKKINLAFFICLIFGISSCGDEEVLTLQNEKQPLSVANDSAFFRSEADAVFSAINAISKAYPNDKRIKSKKSLTVKSVKSLKSDNNQSTNGPGFYIINFEGGGFAMISNDTRATEVYAYSDEGALYPGVNDNVDYYMSLANDYLNYEIDSSNRVITSIPITPVPDPDSPEDYILVSHEDHYCHEVPINKKTTGSTEHLLYTEWHQDEPYNSNCLNSSGEPVYAGCIAIALGQIMAYHQKPLSHNGHTYLWDLITQYPNLIRWDSGAQSVSELINDIGISAGINYWNGSSTATLNGACNALTSFGYNNISSDYSYPIIVNNIDANRPCLICGNNNNDIGHAWVIDGYNSTTTTYQYYTQTTLIPCRTKTVTRSLVHCNWGFNGNSNGFFLSGVFSVPNNFNYSSNLKMIHNIYQ